MSLENVPEALSVGLQDMVALAIEHWRLSGAVAGVRGPGASLVRHALRKMEDVLRRYELEARSMNAQPFDAGLAATVVDSADDPRLARGRVVVEQTLSPLVLWRGRVIKEAQVAVRRGTAGQGEE